MSKPINDLTNERFGNLEVLRMEYINRYGRFLWWAICKCHICKREDYIIKPSDLKNGYKNLENCGCDRNYIFEKQRGKNNKKFAGFEEVHGRYVSNIKRRAKKHKLDFDLSAEFLWNLYLKQNKKCALSGVELIFDLPGNKEYKYFESGNASLDRIDSSKGYTKDNVQWVHKDINLMKMYLKQDNFINWCRTITKFNSLTSKRI